MKIKIKKIATKSVIILLLFPFMALGQGNGLYEFIGKNGKYGFMDKTGKM